MATVHCSRGTPWVNHIDSFGPVKPIQALSQTNKTCWAFQEYPHD